MLGSMAAQGSKVPSATRASGPRVAILQHVAPEGPGLIAEALSARGTGLEVVRVDQGAAVPRDGEPFAGLVVMGGPMGVYEARRYPHLRDELALIEWFLRRGRPILGVCLGSQLLAAALGARVSPGRPEIGWIPVELEPEGERDALLGHAPRCFTPLQWHGDSFEVPRGAACLARSAITETQGFRHGRAWGLLFHLETTSEQVADMTRVFADELRRHHLDGAILAAEAGARLEAIAPFARGVFDAWASVVARSVG
jgi:GMP synthase (glutamine-hydrolysing)